MAFIFTVDLDQSIPTDVVRSGGSKAYIAYVGMDDACPLTYSTIVGLSPSAGSDEYYFKLVASDAETGEILEEYWDGRQVGEFISDEDKARILSVILRITKLLIHEERPECFYCCTHGDNMPPPALEKYERINHVFTECGYQVRLTDSRQGRYSWWVERP